MKKIRIGKLKPIGIYLASLLLFLVSCSTPPKILIGTGIGAAAGAAIGHNVGEGTNESRIAGAILGAGIGSLIAYAVTKKSEVQSKEQIKSEEDFFPQLSKPKLRSVWVPDKIEGNQYIKGHYIYIIEDAGSWSR